MTSPTAIVAATNAAFAKHGLPLRAGYLPAEDESVDDCIEIRDASGQETSISVQLGYGYACINESSPPEEDFWMRTLATVDWPAAENVADAVVLAALALGLGGNSAKGTAALAQVYDAYLKQHDLPEGSAEELLMVGVGEVHGRWLASFTSIWQAVQAQEDKAA